MKLFLSLSTDESNDSNRGNDSEEFDIRVEQGWLEESISSSEVDDSVQSNTEHEINDSNRTDDDSQDEELNEKSDMDLD